MDDLLDQICSIQAIGWMLFHSIWIGIVWWLIHVALQVMLRGWDSRVRYAAAYISIILLALSVTTVWLAAEHLNEAIGIPSWSTRVSNVPHAATGQLPSPRPPNIQPWLGWVAVVNPWLPFVVAAWGVGTFIAMVRSCTGLALLNKRAGSAPLLDMPSVRETVERLCLRLKLRGIIEVRTVNFVNVAATMGWLRPVILVPFGMVANLSPVELESILAHELAHIRRRDYLANLMQSFIESLLFYHPCARWIGSDIRALRELCCDDLAVSVMSGTPREYGETLLAAETTGFGKRFVLGLLDGSVLDRVQHLVRQQRRPMRRGYTHLIGGLCAAGLASSVAMGYVRARVQEQELVAYAESHTFGQSVYHLLGADRDNPQLVYAVITAVKIQRAHQSLTREELYALAVVVNKGGKADALLRAAGPAFGLRISGTPIPGMDWQGGGQSLWNSIARQMQKTAIATKDPAERHFWGRAALLLASQSAYEPGTMSAGKMIILANFPDMTGLSLSDATKLRMIVSIEDKRTWEALGALSLWATDPHAVKLPPAVLNTLEIVPHTAWILNRWNATESEPPPRRAEVEAALRGCSYKFGTDPRYAVPLRSSFEERARRIRTGEPLPGSVFNQ